MTTTIPVDPVPAAALVAGVCPWVVVPATVPCPECRNGHWVTWAPDRHAYVCVMCNGSGVVPLSVSPGDRVRLLVSDRLPADGTIYGRDRTGTPEWFAAVYAPADAWLTNTDARWLPLRPGSVWTATVTDVLPIIDWLDGGEVDTPHILIRDNGRALLYTGENNPLDDITAHTVWQPGEWAPGRTALHLTDIKENA